MSRADLDARRISALFVAFSALMFFTIVVLMERACAAPLFSVDTAPLPERYEGQPLFAECGLDNLLPPERRPQIAARTTREGRSAAFHHWAEATRPVTPGLLAFGLPGRPFAAALSARVEPEVRYCPSGARV